MLEKIKPCLTNFVNIFTNNDNHLVPNNFVWLGRGVITLTLMALAVAYDNTVPEIGGDMRWNVMHASALSMLSLLLLTLSINKTSKLSLSLPPIGWAVLVLTLTAIASIIWTVSLPRSWWFLKHFIGYMSLFSFIYILRDIKWYRLLIWVIALTIGLNGVLAICQFNQISDSTIVGILPFLDGFPSLIDRFQQSAPPAGTLSNKNLLASFITLTLPIIFYLIISSKAKVEKVLATTMFTLGMIALVYTRSRASWLSTIAGIIFVGGWILVNPEIKAILKKYIVNKSTLIHIVVSLIVTIGFAQLQSPIQNKHSVGRSISEQFSTLASPQTHDVMKTRIAYNLNGVEIVKDYPFGIGIGAFHTIYPEYYKAKMETPRIGYSVTARPQRTHNDIMQTFIELGLIGGLTMCFIFLTILHMVWKLTKHKSVDDNIKIFTFFAMIGISALGVNSLGDFPLQMPMAPAIMWSLMGCVAGLYASYHPQGYIKSKTALVISRPFVIILLIITITGLILVTKDDIKRRAGAQYLRYSMILSMQKQYDQKNYSIIKKSFDTYPLNARTREYLGLISANAKKHVSYQHAIANLEDVLVYDPYSSSTLINLGGLYSKLAKRNTEALDQISAMYALNKANESYVKLMKVAPFSPQPYIIKATIFNMINQPAKALIEYQKAKRIAPNMKVIDHGIAISKQNIMEMQNKAEK